MAQRWSLASGTLGRDLALAGASLLGGLTLFGLDAWAPITWSPGVRPWLFLLPLAGVCAAVALRRIATGTSLALGTVAVLADLAFGGSLATVLIYTQVLYDACVYGPSRLWRWLLGSTVALSVLGALVGVAAFGSWRGIGIGVPVVLAGVLPVLTGISVRQYRDQAATERARAEQTARLVELDRCQAVSAERSRMARELHDVIANHLSAVAIHATAALSVPGLDRRQVEGALRVIRENSVQGLAEMRQMIGLLREPAEETTRVRLVEVDRLVDRVRSAGLAVRAEVTGEHRELPVSVDLAAYRIVQESLTNALKHGGGEARLLLGYRPDRITVTVENPLPAATTAPAPRDATGAGPQRGGGPAAPGPELTGPQGAGAGLIGMRERATLLDGVFDAGPYGRLWRVHAELPTGEPAAAAPAPGPVRKEQSR